MKTTGFRQLVAEEMGGEFVRFVAHDEPTGTAEFLLQVFVAGRLVEPGDEDDGGAPLATTAASRPVTARPGLMSWRRIMTGMCLNR